jgi:uncharacterized protein
MGTNQYHEPPEELSPEVRTFARMSTSLIEEVEAIGWYQQRISVEPDAQARAIMEDAQKEEFKHFSMDLEFLLRRTPLWREIAQRTLFTEGDIVSLGTEAEETAGEEEEPGEPGPEGIPETGSLGIGSLREGGGE